MERNKPAKTPTKAHWKKLLNQVSYIFRNGWGKTRQVKASGERINNTIKAKDALAADLILQYESGKSDLTPEKIINTLKDVKSSETFFDFFSDYVEEKFKKNQDHEATSLDGKGKNIWSFFYDKDFNGEFPNLERENEKSLFRKVVNKDIRFASITPSFLRNLAIYLEVEGEHSERSVFNHMNVIRTVYNRAIESKAITRENYPFSGKGGYKMRMPESQKIALEENQHALQAWQNRAGSNLLLTRCKMDWDSCI